MNTLLEYLPFPLNELFIQNRSRSIIQEVRLRVGKPVMLLIGGKEYFLNKSGQAVSKIQDSFYADKNILKDILGIASSYSLYAFEDEIRQGFITVPGGHRIGVCGKIVKDNGRIKTIKDISGINIRIANAMLGCAEEVMKYIYNCEGVLSTLLVSSVCGGKTTLLRDMVRLISNGWKEHRGINVTVIDERSEIGACYLGEAQNDIGIRTDIMDACSKQDGFLMVLRSMSPQLIAVDEIGAGEDIAAVRRAMYCGVKVLASVHADSYTELYSKPGFQSYFKEEIFDRYIILKNKKLWEIRDKKGNILKGDA